MRSVLIFNLLHLIIRFFMNIWLICLPSDFLPGLYFLSLRLESNV